MCIYIYILVHNGVSSIKIIPHDMDNKPVNFDHVHYYKMTAFGLAEVV